MLSDCFPKEWNNSYFPLVMYLSTLCNPHQHQVQFNFYFVLVWYVYYCHFKLHFPVILICISQNMRWGRNFFSLHGGHSGWLTCEFSIHILCPIFLFAQNFPSLSICKITYKLQKLNFLYFLHKNIFPSVHFTTWLFMWPYVYFIFNFLNFLSWFKWFPHLMKEVYLVS